VIIGIDPGKVTGLCVAEGDFISPQLLELPAYEAMIYLDQRLRRTGERVHAVVCERYTQQSLKITPQYDALEVIGVVRFITRQLAARLVLQGRAQRKIVTDDMLRAVGWWKRAGDGHANDAARHTLLFLSTVNPSHPLVQRTIGKMAVIG
jgi:hypothetical protein